MNVQLVILFTHVVAAIFLVGYALFWAIMTTVARREVAGPESSRLLDVAAGARWPLAANKLSLVAAGWLVLVAAAVTGILAAPAGFSAGDLVSGGKFSSLLLAKLVLLVVLALSFLRLGAPSNAPWLAHARLLVVLAIVVVSALLIR